MNKRIVTFWALAGALAIGTASCSDKGTEVATYNNNYEQTLVQDDSASVQVSHSIEYYTSFRGGRALRRKINEAIVRSCFGEEYSGFSVEEASDAVSDTLITGYQKDAGEIYDDEVSYAKDNGIDSSFDPAAFCNWYYVTKGMFAQEYRNLLTYLVFSESYTGGAHGMYYSIPYIIDTKTGGIVTENDLFRPGYVGPVTDLIRESLGQKQQGGAFDVLFEDGVLPNGKCGVSGEGVTWYFQPYEIASYAEGIIDVTVSWADLKPYLNPDRMTID